MRPRRAALSSLRGTLCFWPETVTPTSSVRVAFHCARRLRVFARDILRLGTAMVGPNSSVGASGACPTGWPVGPNVRRLRIRIVGGPLVAKMGAHRERRIHPAGRARHPYRRRPGLLDVTPAVPANLPVGWLIGGADGLCRWSWPCPYRELLGVLRRPAVCDARNAPRRPGVS